MGYFRIRIYKMVDRKMKYKELKSLLYQRELAITILHFEKNELNHLLNQKVLIGDYHNDGKN